MISPLSIPPSPRFVVTTGIYSKRDAHNRGFTMVTMPTNDVIKWIAIYNRGHKALKNYCRISKFGFSLAGRSTSRVVPNLAVLTQIRKLLKSECALSPNHTTWSNMR